MKHSTYFWAKMRTAKQDLFHLFCETWLLAEKWASSVLAQTNFVLLTFLNGIKLKRNSMLNKYALKNIFLKSCWQIIILKGVKTEEVLTFFYRRPCSKLATLENTSLTPLFFCWCVLMNIFAHLAVHAYLEQFPFKKWNNAKKIFSDNCHDISKVLVFLLNHLCSHWNLVIKTTL